MKKDNISKFLLISFLVLVLSTFNYFPALGQDKISNKTFSVEIRPDLSLAEKVARQKLNSEELVAGKDYIAGEILIKLKPGINKDVSVQTNKVGDPIIDQLNQKFGVSRVDKVFHSKRARQAPGLADIYKFNFSNEQDIREVIAEYETSEKVIWAEPNYKAKIEVTTPNDTLYSSQWHLNNTGQTGGTADADIDAPEVWDTERGDSNIIVGVVDSGVDTDHTDLSDNMWTNTGETASNGLDDDNNGYVDDIYGWDFIGHGQWDGSQADEADPNPNPDGLDNDSDGFIDNGVTHGTHVAGIIGADSNNSNGVAGVAWGVQIMAVRVLDDEGWGGWSDIADGIIYAADNGANVINLSLGGSTASSVLEDAVDYAYDNGVALIAAAGNDAKELTNSDNQYPAGYSNVFSVASTDDDDLASWFTNYGASYIDVSAPGSSIYSTLYYNPTYGFNSYYGSMSGTSMATPVVAGIAALVKSYNVGLTNAQIYNYISNNAENVGLGSDYGSGRVNANDTIDAVPPYTDTTDPTNPTISAYTGSNKTTELDSDTRYTDTSPYFEWSGATDTSGIAGYYVYFGTNQNANPKTAGNFQTSTSYSVSGLSGDDENNYLKIKTRDLAGNITGSSASFKYVIDTVASAPDNLSSSLQEEGISLSWDNTDSNQSSYNIYRATSSGGTYTKLNSVAVTNATFLDDEIDTDDVRGSKYYYVVTTVDDLSNESVYSNELEATYYPAADIIIGTGPGGGPQVRVFKPDGTLISQFFAYNETFRGGVNIAVGDLDGDGVNEIVTGAGSGGGPQVRIFDRQGNIKFTTGFFAYAEHVRNGVFVAVGDLNGDGEGEIVTGTGPRSGPHVRTFDRFGNSVFSPGFFAYQEHVRNGVFVTAGDLDGDGKDEIITGTGLGSGPHVRVFNFVGDSVFTPGFFPYDSKFRGGVRVGVGDLDGNGKKEILTSPGTGGGPQVRAFNRYGDPRVTNGFFAFDSNFHGGIYLAGGDTNQDGKDEVIVSVGAEGSPQIRVFDPTDASILEVFYGLPQTFLNGINVASGAMN